MQANERDRAAATAAKAEAEHTAATRKSTSKWQQKAAIAADRNLDPNAAAATLDLDGDGDVDKDDSAIGVHQARELAIDTSGGHAEVTKRLEAHAKAEKMKVRLRDLGLSDEGTPKGAGTVALVYISSTCIRM